MKIEKKKLLRKYNTIRVDCIASYFIEAKNEEDVLRGVEYSKKRNIPFLIIGRGSNLILPSLYQGVVIFLAMSSFDIFKEENKVILRADAGSYLPEISYELTKYQATGMEWAGGVPGSIGGAVRGNAGAFGSFMSDYINKVKAVDLDSLEKKYFSQSECNFDYRESFFKKNKNILITEAEMTFCIEKSEKDKFKEYLLYRKEKHPSDPSAGSIFKNPEISIEFSSNFPEIANDFKEKGVVPAGLLIEKCGLKGEKRKGAEISVKHANFIINKGGASGEDVVNLINFVKKRVKEKFGVDMIEEVEIIK